MTQLNIAIGPPPSGPICDFCSSAEVFAAHISEKFIQDPIQTEFGVINITNDGLWGACRICDELIRQEDWSQLLDRSLLRFVEQVGFMPPPIRNYIAECHRLFRQFRKVPS